MTGQGWTPSVGSAQALAHVASLSAGESADPTLLVLDPCYRGTDVDALARELPCPIEWHAGFRLPVEVLRQHPEYRGPEHVELGLALAVDGYLTPALIGDAARSGQYDLQDLKRVWHYLARFGDLACPAS
ncbi:DUF3626 domain-containing protein [Sorangium sp. So ce542]